MTAVGTYYGYGCNFADDCDDCDDDGDDGGDHGACGDDDGYDCCCIDCSYCSCDDGAPLVSDYWLK